MKRELPFLKEHDWSLNLEDEYFAEHPEDLVAAAVHAVEETAPGYYVNLVTPGSIGHPETDFIPGLKDKLRECRIRVREIRYVDECGCGGHVTRVYR
ncbi:MAG: hypothetical protein BAA02_12840 [Paenibacillaceae bacterium ZCTH02-B3]|nr:MAG: hypothetical protein BAA02_12840 [Paenibacillaceae bacterium ZCTH02-B3]